MDITMITSENLPHFKTLLLPGSFAMMEAQQPVTALGLVEGRVACGALAGYVEDETFRLTSLFVAEGYRRRGGAQLLMDTLCRVLRDDPSLYTLSADYTVTREDHRVLERFLEKYGFENQDNGQSIYCVTMEQIAQASFFSGKPGSGEEKRLLPFSKIPDIYIQIMDRKLAADGGRPLEKPMEQAELDRDVSVGVLDGNKLIAFVAFDFSFDGQMTLAYAYSGPKAGPAALPSMLHSAFRRAVAKYPPETPLYMHAANPTSAALIHQLLGEVDCRVASHTATLSVEALSYDVDVPDSGIIQ